LPGGSPALHVISPTTRVAGGGSDRRQIDEVSVAELARAASSFRLFLL
jgi:hypothetical protein